MKEFMRELRHMEPATHVALLFAILFGLLLLITIGGLLYRLRRPVDSLQVDPRSARAQFKRDLNAAWIGARVRAAVARRLPLRAESDALRLVYGEADCLPGFIADRYGNGSSRSYLLTPAGPQALNLWTSSATALWPPPR